MVRQFVETSIFTKRWIELGLDDGDLSALQNYLLKNSSAGDNRRNRRSAKITLCFAPQRQERRSKDYLCGCNTRRTDTFTFMLCQS